MHLNSRHHRRSEHAVVVDSQKQSTVSDIIILLLLIIIIIVIIVIIIIIIIITIMIIFNWLFHSLCAKYIRRSTVYKKLITRWDGERELFYDDIVHVPQSTIDSRINSATDIGLSQCLNRNPSITTKSDKLTVSNSEIHFTRECVNLVTHTNFTALCVIEADF